MRILFCGLGSIGQRHLRNTISILGTGVELMAFRKRNSSPVLKPDMSVNSGKELAEVYPIKEFFDLDQALEENPDIVFITNPNSEHIHVAQKAAKRGCHLFIEKPVSDSLQGIDDLVQLVREKKLSVFVAYQFRFHPALKKIKSWLTEERIGKITSAHIVNAEYLPDWHPYEDYKQTHPIWKKLGGGSHHIQTHELDYAIWFFGLPNFVYASGGKLSDLAGDAVDSVDILLSYEDQQRTYPVHIHLDYLQWPHQRFCEIVGTKGKITFDYYSNELKLYLTQEREEEKISFSDFERNNMFIDELNNFFTAVKTKTDTAIGLKEGLQSLYLSHAIERSLALKQPVRYEG